MNYIKRYEYEFVFLGVLATVFITLAILVLTGTLAHAHHIVHAVPASVPLHGFGAHPPGAAPGVTYPHNVDLPQSSFYECSSSGCSGTVIP